MPNEIEVKPRWITPDEAFEMLTRNTHNRLLSQDVVKKYAADMRANAWQETTDPIKLSPEGTVLDGQHRLSAIVEAMIPVKLWVSTNVPPEAQAAMDRQRPRSSAAILQLAGHPNATVLSAMLIKWRWYLRLRPRGLRFSSTSKSGVTHAMLQEELRLQPRLPELVSTAVSHRTARGMLSPSTTAFVYSGAVRAGDEGKANEWLEGLATGAGLEHDSPIYLLREQRLRARTMQRGKDDDTVLYVAMKSWNMFAAGRTGRVLRWTEQEGIPRFYGDNGWT